MHGEGNGIRAERRSEVSSASCGQSLRFQSGSGAIVDGGTDWAESGAYPAEPVDIETIGPSAYSAPLPLRGASSPGPAETVRGADTSAELKQLRELLLGQKEADIAAVFERVLNDNLRRVQLRRDLPAAIEMAPKESGEPLGRLVKALEPAVVASIKESVAKDRQPVSQALSPVLGAAIVNYLAGFHRQIRDAISARVESATSPGRFRCYLEAMFTGIPCREYIRLRTEVFEVEEACLLDRSDFSIIKTATVYARIDSLALDPSEPSEECRAVENFLMESRSAGKPLQYSDHLTIGAKRALIIHGTATSLAVIVSGHPSPELEHSLQAYAAEMDQLFSHFGKDPVSVDTRLSPVLEKCLIKHSRRDLLGSSRRSRIVFYGLGFAALFLLGSLAVWDYRWSRFEELVRATPGVEVTRINRGFRESLVSGLHDPLQQERAPDVLLEEAGLDLSKIKRSFVAFHSLEESFASIRREAEDRRILLAANDFRRIVDERENVLRKEMAAARRLEILELREEDRKRIEGRSLEILRRELSLPEDFRMTIQNQLLVLEGGLEEPAYSCLLLRASSLTLVNGLETSKLRDLTGNHIAGLVEKIESTLLPFSPGSATADERTMAELVEVANLCKELIVQAQKKRWGVFIELHALPVDGDQPDSERSIDRIRLANARLMLTEFGLGEGVLRGPRLDETPNQVPVKYQGGVYAKVLLEKEAGPKLFP